MYLHACTSHPHGLLLNLSRSNPEDLEKMEEIVMSSGLDYLLVRPMGVDPAEPPRNSYKLVTAAGSQVRKGASKHQGSCGRSVEILLFYFVLGKPV